MIRDPGAGVTRLVGARAAERVHPAILRYARGPGGLGVGDEQRSALVHERVRGQCLRIGEGDHAVVGTDRRHLGGGGTGARPRVRVGGGDVGEPGPHPRRLVLGVGERAALMGTEGVLVEREAVEGAADADGERAGQLGPERRDGRAVARGRPWQRGPGPAGAGRRPGAFGAGEQHHAGLTGGDAGRRRVEHPDRRLAPGGVDPTAGGRDVERQPVGDQRGEIVVRPRADRHQVEHVDPGQQTATRVGAGRPRRGGDEGERLRGSGVVVVAVGDLTDPDDDGDGCRHPVSIRVRSSPGYPARSRSRGLHCAFAPRRDTRLAHAHAVSMARSLLAGIPGSLTLTRSHRRRAP